MNANGVLAPALLVTVMFETPAAELLPIVSVTAICLRLTTVKFPTVTPGVLTATVAPGKKFVPVIVTGTVVPCAPLAGLTKATVGREPPPIVMSREEDALDTTFRSFAHLACTATG